MSDLARLGIWDDPAIRDGLSWYLAVAENKRPAKFRIAATLPTQLDPATSGEEALWAELDRLTPIFLTRWQAIRAGAGERKRTYRTLPFEAVYSSLLKS
jgi:putative pyruvate formate lyase activating enzyme